MRFSTVNLAFNVSGAKIPHQADCNPGGSTICDPGTRGCDAGMTCVGTSSSMGCDAGSEEIMIDLEAEVSVHESHLKSLRAELQRVLLEYASREAEE